MAMAKVDSRNLSCGSRGWRGEDTFMKLLVMVSQTPWGIDLPLTVRALDGGHNGEP